MVFFPEGYGQRGQLVLLMGLRVYSLFPHHRLAPHV